MSLSLVATAEPTHEPPRVLLEVAESDTANTITSLSLFRNGVPLRFEPLIAGRSALAYDYDAPFDQVLTYRADGTESGVTVDWTETWASVASWTGSGWSVSAGVASSSGINDTIYRNTTGTVGRLSVTSPSNVTVQLLDATGTVLISVIVAPSGTVTVTGSVTAQTVTGSGTFSIDIAGASVTVSGSSPSPWTATVPYSGAAATRVRLIGPGGGVYESQFGMLGADDGKFNKPRGIARDGSGNLFVVDSVNNRVQKFNSAGVYQSQFGSAGTGNGQFALPFGIAIDGSGNIFVVDNGNRRVQKFNSSGVYQSQFGTLGSGNGQFNNPLDIGIDGSGNMFVVDSGNNRVQKFNSAGTYQSQFGTSGSGNGQFANPAGIAIDGSGNMWVADTDNHRVQKFNSSGTYQSQFGSLGADDGKFTYPVGIELDGSGNIFVVDTSDNNRVQKFNSSGVFQYKFGAYGTGNGQLSKASSLVISGTSVWVSDTFNNRVQKFSTAPGSVDDIVAYKFSSSFPVTASDTETLSPSGDQAGVWLMNASTPDLAILAEHDPSDGDDEYVIMASSKVQTGSSANSVALPIEGSADVVTVSTGPRRRKQWTLDIGCMDEDAVEALDALLADSAVVSLRVPGTAKWRGLPGGFYAVGDVSSERMGHPQMGPVEVVSLPLTPSRAPVYLPLWQWNWRTLAQTGMSWADANASYLTWRDQLVGPVT